MHSVRAPCVQFAMLIAGPVVAQHKHVHGRALVGKGRRRPPVRVQAQIARNRRGAVGVASWGTSAGRCCGPPAETGSAAAASAMGGRLPAGPVRWAAMVTGSCCAARGLAARRHTGHTPAGAAAAGVARLVLPRVSGGCRAASAQRGAVCVSMKSGVRERLDLWSRYS
jgi:hypothetical protein